MLFRSVRLVPVTALVHDDRAGKTGPPQWTLRNEYTPEGILALEVVGLQKCSVRVSVALAYAFRERPPNALGGAMPVIKSDLLSPAIACVTSMQLCAATVAGAVLGVE